MPASHIKVPALLREEWGKWLGQRPWDLFLTLTSDHRTHPEALHKRFRYCAHTIADKLWGRHWDRRGHGIEYVLGMERHKSGWPHSHAVMRLPGVDMGDPAQFNLAYWQEWISSTGGFCNLQRPRGQGDVVGYCTKYVLKEGDLVLSPNLNPYEVGGQLALFNPGARRSPRPRGQ